MRLSLALCRQHLGFHFRMKWKKFRMREIPPLTISPLVQKHLEERGKELVNPLIKKKKFSPFEFLDPRFQMVIPTGKDNPLYKERICYKGSFDTQLLEGQRQAMILTKTICKEGLPQSLQGLSTESFPDQDERMQELIMQALVWDPAMDKLPKIIDPEKVWWNFKRVFGIPIERKSSILLSNLLRICDILVTKFPDIRHRRVFENILASVTYKKGEHLIQYQYSAPYLMTSNKPLPTFTSRKEIDDSSSQELETIYPLIYTIDLEESQIYSIDNHYVLSHGYHSSYPHTLWSDHVTEKQWAEEQIYGKALLGCFTYALAFAHLKYGTNVRELPSPVCIQCIQSCYAKTFNFYAFQLNSADLRNEDGIKNFFWCDPGYELYGELDENKNLVDYNPDVFKKILHFYLNGLR